MTRAEARDRRAVMTWERLYQGITALGFTPDQARRLALAYTLELERQRFFAGSRPAAVASRNRDLEPTSTESSTNRQETT